jgi:hypothetical protein
MQHDYRGASYARRHRGMTLFINHGPDHDVLLAAVSRLLLLLLPSPAANAADAKRKHVDDAA